MSAFRLITRRSWGHGTRAPFPRNIVCYAVTNAGRHSLQIPGPTNVPGPILRAIEQPTVDHHGPELERLGQEVLEGIREIFKTLGAVVIFPSSGTWETATI